MGGPRYAPALLCSVLLALSPQALACTIFYACDGDLALGGNNEDWIDSDTWMWVEPGDEGRHGAVYFGFGNFFPQGGVNDQGLFYDGAATAPLALEDTEGKAEPLPNLLQRIMQTCGRVDEAVEFLDQYHIPSLERAILFFGDAEGGSVMYEGDEVIYGEERHHVLTNYYQSRQSARQAGCWRKQAAEKIFAERFAGDEPLTLELMRDVLEATHQKGKAATRYSNIYDLTHGKIHLYRERDFDRALVLDVEELLAKGAHKVQIEDLFAAPEQSVRRIPESWNDRCPKSGRPVLADTYFEHEGIRVYFCNPHCAEDGAKDPELWIAKVYPGFER